MFIRKNRRTEAERAEANRPVDYTEYQQAINRGKPIDILRLNTDTCPEDTKELFELIQNTAKQRR